MAKKKQEIKATDIIVVLDRSGSMDSIGQPTVDGFNSFVKEQKEAEGEANLTLVQFDNVIDINYTNLDVKHVKDLILGETYVPRATTSLFDAIGVTINSTKTKNDVVFVIITDGAENASKEFDQKKVFEMIDTKKKEGWNFLFLGANQDAIKVGGSFGISAGNSANWSANDASAKNMYMNFSGKISSYRSAKANVSVTSDELNSTLTFNEADRNEIK